LTSDVGNFTNALFPGVSSLGAVVHARRNERDADQPETAPVFVTPRTRHQYVPLGGSFVSVAHVFFVVIDPTVKPEAAIGDEKLGSALSATS
jgi:hypothetical protein